MTRMTIRFLPTVALVALIAPWTVLGQTSTTQVFRFLPTITRSQTEEIAIAISTITGMTVRDDFAKGVLSVQGTPDQIKLGAWLLSARSAELVRPSFLIISLEEINHVRGLLYIQRERVVWIRVWRKTM